MKRNWIFSLAAVLALFAQGAAAQVVQEQEFPRDLHGLWWQPAHPGWAAAMFDQGSAMSSTIMTYDFEGKSTWYIAPRLSCFRELPPWSQTLCDGPLYKVTGSYFGGSSWRTSDVSLRRVGNWEGSFLWPLFGGIGPNLSRMLFLNYNVDGLTFLSAGNQPMEVQAVDPAAPFLWRDGRYSGMWWTPHESGWGIGLFVQNRYLQATLYVFGPDNQPRWYVVVASASPFDDRPDPIYEGDVYETRGEPFNRVSAVPITVRRVGAASVHFGATQDEPARLNYSIDNIHVSKAIVRTP